MQSLADAGLVERTAHPEDRRQALIAATEAGAALVRDTRRRRDLWLSKRLAALTSAERATLVEAERILRRLYTE